MKTIILTALLLAAAVIMLGVKVLFVKGGKFPSSHVHDIGQKQRRDKNN